MKAPDKITIGRHNVDSKGNVVFAWLTLDDIPDNVVYIRKDTLWKPSEEQIEALESAVKLYKDTHFEVHHKKIVSLYEDLKKL